MNSVRELLVNRLLQCTREQPMDRYREARRHGINERMIRKMVTDLRREGWRVCADSSGKGYWIAQNETDYIRFRKEYVSRATEIFETVKAMDGSTEGQIGGLESYR